MALSQADLDKLFSAEKEHGVEVATAFKAFVSSLDAAIPDGMEKNSILAHLRRASDLSHSALDRFEQMAKNALHQRAKSGEKPVTAPSAVQPPAEVPTQDAPPVEPAPAVAPVTPAS